MNRSTGRLVSCLAAMALSGLTGMSTARAGITLVITVSDSNGSATQSFTSSSNTYTYDNTNTLLQPNSVVGDSKVFNDFQIYTTGSTNAPGTSTGATPNGFATDNSTTISYIGNPNTSNSSTGTVTISVIPTPFTSPGSPGNPGSTAYVSSRITASTGTFAALGFVTFVAQNSGTFTPGFQSVPPDSTSGSSGTIYSQFSRDAGNYGLANRTTYVLPQGGDAVSTTGTSRVTLTQPAGTQTTPIATPEPTTFALALAGLPLVAFRAWRGRRARPSA